MKHSELRHQPRHVNPRIQEIWLRKCRISQMNLILHLNILSKIDSL